MRVLPWFWRSGGLCVAELFVIFLSVHLDRLLLRGPLTITIPCHPSSPTLLPDMFLLIALWCRDVHLSHLSASHIIVCGVLDVVTNVFALCHLCSFPPFFTLIHLVWKGIFTSVLPSYTLMMMILLPRTHSHRPSPQYYCFQHTYSLLFNVSSFQP